MKIITKIKVTLALMMFFIYSFMNVFFYFLSMRVFPI